MKATKHCLFSRLQQQGLFWNYANDTRLGDIGEQALIETCFRYAD